MRFQGIDACKLPFLVINRTFFPQIQILIFLHETTQNDHNSLLYKFENDQNILVLLGVVDMRQLFLKLDRLYFIRKVNVFQEDIITGEQKLAYLIEIKRSKNIQIKTYYSF